MMTIRRRYLSLILLAVVTACADNISATGKGGNSKPDFRVRATTGEHCFCNTPTTLWGQTTLPFHIYSVVSGQTQPNNPVVDRQGNLIWVEYYGHGSAGTRIWMRAKSAGTFFGKPFLEGQAQPISADSGGDIYYRINLDAAGNVYIPDYWGLIRVIPQQDGVFFGQTLTAGTIATIAGGGAGTGNDGELASNSRIIHGRPESEVVARSA